MILDSIAIGILQFFEIFTRISYVYQCRLRWNARIGHDHHDIGVAGKGVNESGKRTVADLHGLKFSAQLRAAQLELFNYVGDFLKTMRITILFALAVRYNQKGCLLKQQNFIGLYDIGEMCQRVFQGSHIGY